MKPEAAGIAPALLAALLFGASTPFAKLLSAQVAPVLLAGLLYAGSGIGLWTIRLLHHRRLLTPDWTAGDWFWFFCAIVSGGVLGPILLMIGLTRTSAGAAALLLNLEAVLTALLAWVVFREHASRRLVFGMVLIVAGGTLLAWPRAGAATGTFGGALLIAAACACWAIDNNLTRKLAAGDADFIAGTKGLAAGATNLMLATALGDFWPSPTLVACAMALGLLGYGVSLVLFVRALRGLGSARASAYFSSAPFLGAALSVIVLHETATPGFWASGSLMAAGVLLHLNERHAHRHSHEALAHSHPHVHDAHHRHAHEFAWNGTEPHAHPHRHDPLTHDHPHYPDLHHRHGH